MTPQPTKLEITRFITQLKACKLDNRRMMMHLFRRAIAEFGLSPEYLQTPTGVPAVTIRKWLGRSLGLPPERFFTKARESILEYLRKLLPKKDKAAEARAFYEEVSAYDHNDKASIHKLLKRAEEEFGITPEFLHAETRASEKAVGNWLSGRNTPITYFRMRIKEAILKHLDHRLSGKRKKLLVPPPAR